MLQNRKIDKDFFNKYSENFDDIDLVLLDLVMPNKDGLYFYDKILSC